MLGSSFADQQIIRMCKQEVNIDNSGPASSGGQGKYVKCVSFPWPPLEAAENS